MELTTSQLELLYSNEDQNYTTFTNSELFSSKDIFKKILNEIVVHGHIFDIILDKASNSYTRPIEALGVEEPLSLKMLLSDKYNPTEILNNAIQYKNFRLFFVDAPDKDSYYYLVDFIHDNDFYISIILLKDFPADESSDIQYSIIRDIIQLYFTISFKKLGIHINYDINNYEVICFPYTLRSSDFVFIALYYAYYLEALSAFVPISAIENTINADGLSLLFADEDSLKILHDRNLVINGTPSDLVDYTYMVTTSYFKNIVQLAASANGTTESNQVIDSEEDTNND